MTPSSDLVKAAAAAVAAALPVPAQLSAGEPVATAQFSSAPAFLLPDEPGAGVLARLDGPSGSASGGEVAVIVGADLVQVLANSPLGALDLAAAVQPALDAAAQAAGAGSAAAGQQLDVDLALESLLNRPDAHIVPLSDESGLVTATVVITLPGTAAAEPAFAPVGEPEKLAPEVATLDTEAAPQVHLPQQVAVPRGGAPDAARHGGGLDLLRDVAMEVTVELGRTRMTVRELLSLTPGAVVELDRAAGSPADLLVNGTLIARGEIVVVDEDFGIRITEIVAPGADGAGDLPSSGRGAA